MKAIPRRRFLRILATGASGLSLAPLTRANAGGWKTHRWRGYVLGAEGAIDLHTNIPGHAREALNACFEEIKRLERLFSLYDPDSELCRLNREGVLHQPGEDWLAVLAACDRTHRLTLARFDPTVQPLWDLFARHYRPTTATGSPSAPTPPAREVEAVLRKTGWSKVRWDKNRIEYGQRGMKMTLNGIAQGYITDCVTNTLSRMGFAHALIELGETRALGSHSDGSRWRIGIQHARRRDALFDVVELDRNRAIATSGGYGTRLSPDGRINHLIDPTTGSSAAPWSSVSVIADTATEADALSTGLMFLPERAVESVRAQCPALTIITQA